MECRRCKHHFSDKYLICPNCGTPIKSNKTNNKTKKKTVKNKYINKDETNLVGGKTTGSGSYVGLKKKTASKPVTKKETTKEVQINKSTKYKSKLLKNDEEVGKGFFSIVRIEKMPKEKPSLSEYKKSISESNIRGKKTGANSAKIKYAKTSAEAAVKAKREKDLTKVGNAAKTSKYSSGLKNRNIAAKQDNTVKGKFFDSVSYNYEQKQVNKKVNKNKIKLFDMFGYIAVIAVWIVAIYMIFNFNHKDYYFKNSDDSSVVTEYDGVSKSSQVAGISSIGVTSIIYDNQYFKQTNLSSLNDVNTLIANDSVKQKGNCSPNVVEIEKEIIEKYGIIAVNFCEMDYALARELRDVVGYVYNNYPEARNYLTNITIANVGANDTYIAAFMPIFTFATSNTSSGYPIGVKTQIILNAKYFLNTSKLKNSVSGGATSGYFPPNASSSSTIAHEFGHYLSYIAMLNYYKTDKLNFVHSNNSKILYTVYNDFNAGDFSYKLLQEAYEDYQRTYLSYMTFDEFRNSISKYAMAKDNKGQYIYDETIAEAFHDYYLNGYNAKPASKSIVHVLESKL